jgi:hypothetical protein
MSIYYDTITTKIMNQQYIDNIVIPINHTVAKFIKKLRHRQFHISRHRCVSGDTLGAV